MERIVLPRKFLQMELIYDEHNLQQALALGKLKFTKMLAKDMRSQMRNSGFRGMPKRCKHG